MDGIWHALGRGEPPPEWERFAGELGWLWRRFWWAYRTMGELPDVCPTGFLTTYAAALVMMPVVLYVSLAMVWSLASVGPVRKSMTTSFIIILGVPLYPVLSAILMAILWFVAGVFSCMLVTLGPIALVCFLWWQLLDYKHHFVEHQRSLGNGEVQVQDMSCMHLLLGLLMGILSLCTFGLCAAACTLLKAPVVIASLFCQAWRKAGYAWLKLVQCSWCFRSQAPRRSSDEDEGGCFWWYWFPLILAGWLIVVALGVCVAVLVVLVSALLKLLASAIWPAYVTSGWLRYVGPRGTRRRDASCCAALSEGLKAGYQVLWASDVLTNVLILGDFENVAEVVAQLRGYAEGRRDGLGPQCRRLSCFPPVTIGLLGGSWDLASQAIARELGVSADAVEEAWRSLARQMIRIGQEAVASDLLTREWVESVPVELCIGLPARTVLETLERSPVRGEIVLSSGLVLRQDHRPRFALFDEFWAQLMEAQAARAAAQLSGAQRDHLCAALLAGGGDADALPPRLAEAVRDFERLPTAARSQCQAILRPLIAFSVLCSKQQAYKEKLKLAIEGITAENAEDYLGVVRQQSLDAEDAGSSDESSSCE